MTATLPVPTRRVPAVPNLGSPPYQDITGCPADVLATIGGYYQRGEMLRYDRTVEHPDGTVTVRVWLRPGTVLRDLVHTVPAVPAIPVAPAAPGPASPSGPTWPEPEYDDRPRKWHWDEVALFITLVFFAVMGVAFYIFVKWFENWLTSVNGSDFVPTVGGLMVLSFVTIVTVRMIR